MERASEAQRPQRQEGQGNGARSSAPRGEIFHRQQLRDMADVGGRRRDHSGAAPLPAGGSRKAPAGSHLRADAPAFRPEELPRPVNLKNLKTRRQHSRLEALDLVPFTPSQGVLTPSPNNFAAAAHEQQMYAIYPATPHGQTPMQMTFAEPSGAQPGSDESSTHSFASTISPFHWPLPVSPTAFPVRQGQGQQYLMAPVMDGRATQAQFQGWITGSGQEYVYTIPVQSGSPMYANPESPLVGAAWNRQPFARPRSRLSGSVAGPVLVMQAPGSPVYSGVQHAEYAQGVAVTVYPVPNSPTYSNAGAASSPVWSGASPFTQFSMHPSTPPAAAAKPQHHFGRPVSLTPQPSGHSGASTADGSPDTLAGFSSAHSGNFIRTPADQSGPRMNARQRRTLRRAQEREAKQQAEQEAQRRAEMQLPVQQEPPGAEQSSQKDEAEDGEAGERCDMRLEPAAPSEAKSE